MLHSNPYFRLLIVLTIINIVTDSIHSQAQNINTEKFQYLSPIPGSKLNSTETNIIIRFGHAYDKNNLSGDSFLYVAGSKSGNHIGKITLTENDRTLIFQPDKQFADGETITVSLSENLKSVSGEEIPELQFSFETSKINLNKKVKSNPEKYYKFLYTDLDINKNNSFQKENFSQLKSYTIQNDSFPEGFPKITVDTVNNPYTGFLFFTPFIFPGSIPTYHIITDNYGVPVFYRKLTRGRTFDFKKQARGALTYFEEGPQKHFVLDSSYNIIDTFQIQNGYPTDLHELVILENNHALLMSYDHQKVAMDSVVEGGDSNATVIGLIIQELDESKNVVFQWRSWDHIPITDVTEDFDLTAATIDYVHGNAIEMDYDGNILISNRHLDEITKINRETGDIMWRWGGEHCKSNEFTFINDPMNGFSHQHDVRRLPNGNITIFDNGNLHNPPFSRVVEYQLDEVNKLAFLVWQFRNDPDTYTAFMGSARRLDNHNTFIGWGSSPTPGISEVAADGTIELQISFPDTIINYRAFKFLWKTNLFVSDPDSLSFGFIPVGDSLVKSIVITNNSDQEIEINGILNRDSVFSAITSLPITIAAFDTATIQVLFKPEAEGEYLDDLHLQWNKENERIAQVIPLFGTTDSTYTPPTFVEIDWNKIGYSLSQNYPNPFNPVTNFEFRIADFGLVTLKVFDLLGREVATLINEEKPAGVYVVQFDAAKHNLSSGVYFYQLKIVPFGKQVEKFVSTKKFVLMK